MHIANYFSAVLLKSKNTLAHRANHSDAILLQRDLRRIADFLNSVKRKYTLANTTNSRTNMLLRFLRSRETVSASFCVWKKLPVYLHFEVRNRSTPTKTEHNQSS